MYCTVLPVTIGLQQTAYTVGEVDDYQLVCLEVLSGDIDGREIIINYLTASGTASMNVDLYTECLCVCYVS